MKATASRFSSINSTRTSETLTRLQRVHTQELGATGDVTFKLGPIAAVTGADIRDIRASDNETPISAGLPNGFADATARQRFIGAFGELLGQHKQWSAAVSLRADRASNLSILQSTQTTLTTPPNRTEVVLNPRLGIVRTFGPSAQYPRLRLPRLPHPHHERALPHRPGRLANHPRQRRPQLRARHRLRDRRPAQPRPAPRLQATYFWTEINRPVSAVLISQTATTITNLRENLGQIRSRGLELAATASLLKSLTATIGYQYAFATVTQFSAQPTLVGNWIPEVPRQSFTAQLRSSTARLGQITLAARTTGMAFDDAANQFPLTGFYELDLSGNRTLTHHLDLTYLLQNLTNQRAQVARTPTLTLGSPIYGQAGLRISFK